jgi:aminomethyltransferase
VRVYPEKNNFRKAVAYRMTPDADAELSRETGFHPRTSELTRNFTEYRGFWLPTSFRDYGAIEEYWACRERAVVSDLSALRKFEVVGPDAEALACWMTARPFVWGPTTSVGFAVMTTAACGCANRLRS